MWTVPFMSTAGEMHPFTPGANGKASVECDKNASAVFNIGKREALANEHP
jgi:hypothetical protein